MVQVQEGMCLLPYLLVLSVFIFMTIFLVEYPKIVYLRNIGWFHLYISNGD